MNGGRNNRNSVGNSAGISAKNSNETKQSNFRIMMRLITLVAPLTIQMILGIFLGVLGFIAAIGISVLGFGAVLVAMGEQLGGILAGSTVKGLFIAIAVCAISRGFLRYGEQALNHYIAFKLLARLRNKLFAAMRRLAPAKLEGRDKGDLISLITADIELLEVFYAHTISPVAIAFIVSLLMTAFIWQMHPALGALALAAYFVIGVVVPIAISKFSGDGGKVQRSKAGEISGYALESLRGLDESIQYSRCKDRRDKLAEITVNYADIGEALKVVQARGGSIANAIIVAFDIGMLALGVYLHSQGAVEFAEVALSLIALLSSFGPVIALAALGSGLQGTFAAGGRVLGLLDEVPVTPEVVDGKEVAFTGAALDNITFTYDDEDVILKDLSIKLPYGKVLGVVGRSGSGKSTMLRLLMRFWDVQKGQVNISDQDIRGINTASLRDQQGFLTQQTHLFHDTIGENIRISKPSATQAEVEDAARKASIHDFIMTLPKGYDTPVGELGSTLSGGERQRIGLARAFLHDAPFLLLDEPTSNLDSLNEAVVLQSLQQMLAEKPKTVILVSHRVSTMSVADEILTMDMGRIS